MADDDLKIRAMRRLEDAFSPKSDAELLLRKLILPELCGRLWHTTSEDRFKSILMSGTILVKPDIPDDKRWSTIAGEERYPYVRSIGGVSLFDFDQFNPSDFDHANPDSYSSTHPNSSWSTFIPYNETWGCSVWIEIDCALPQLIRGPALLAKWRLDGCGRKFMPKIEAAHLGDIPRSAFRRAFLVRKDDSEFHHLPIDIFGI